VSQPGPVRRIVIPALCIGLTAAGLYNVYGDSSAVTALAERTACGTPGCAVKMIEYSRTPFNHAYTFQLDVKTGRVTQVACTRAFLFLGDYSCSAK